MVIEKNKACYQTEERYKQDIIYSNELCKKILNKKYILHFLPTSLYYIAESDYIIFGGKKLKTDYIIDIINSLLIKYYFTRDNNYVLNSVVLKDKYGYLYNYYIKYLVANKILTLKKNYSVGKSSRKYSLPLKFLKEKAMRYKNKDTTLLKKFKKRKMNLVDLKANKKNLIDIDVKLKLIRDLYDIEVDVDKSIFFLTNITQKEMGIYNRNLHSVQTIDKKDIFYHFDDYGRMHTNYTILRSFIRQNCLSVDGDDTYEIDIPNSQPLFLTKLIVDGNYETVDKNELELFKTLTKKGNFYEYLDQNYKIGDRKDIKSMTYRVFFGLNGGNSKADKMFKSVFPSIHKFIKRYKKDNGGHKSLSHKLQRMESDFIFNKVVKKIMYQHPEIKMVTIHDSVVLSSKHKDVARSIFRAELLTEFNF